MRSRFIAVVLLAVLLITRWTATSASGELPTPETIGFSQGGLPLLVYRIGDGPNLVLVLGAQHGGPEANTYRLTQALLEYFNDNPTEVPGAVTLAFLPQTNPDGLAAGTRRFLSGVDPNRNWPGPSWETDGFQSNRR